MIEVGSKPVVVTALGAQDGGNWTASTIQVGLWDSEGSTLIAYAFVSNSSPADAGGYRYSAITPVTLQANTRYIIGALGGTGYANFYDGNNATLPFTSGDSNITIVVSTYNESDFFSAPTWTAGGGAGGVRWAFANFKFDSGRQLVVWGDSPITTHPVMNAGVSQAVIASQSVDTNVIAVLKYGSVTTWSLTGDPVSALDAPESTLADVVLLAAGEEHFLALKKDGQVVAWGRGFTDEGAVPNFGQSDVPYDASSGMVAVAAGDYHSLALRKDGRVFAWGWDNDNQCQVPDAARSGVVAIAAGRYTSFALKFDGTLVSWGRGSYGATLPANATNGVVAISAGRQHAMALKSDGTVKAWGTDAEGQETTATGSPVGLSGVAAVSAGRYYSMALKSDRTVQAWGESGYISDSFTAPADLANVVSIQGGRNHGLAIVSDGPAPRLDLPLGPLQILAGSATNLPLKSTVPSPIFSQVGLPAGATLSPAGALSVSNTVTSTNVFARIMVENQNGSDARVVKLQITGNTNPIFAANFNDFTGTPTDKQYQTDHDLAIGANVPGWTKTGTDAARLVNHGAAVADWAVMIYGDDTLTMAAGVDANSSGVTYRVSLDVGPSAGKNNAHSTRADEVLRVLVLDGEGIEIAELPVSPGAWAGSQTFVRRTFTYTGNGNGAVCLKVAAADPSASRIAGAVDNITIAVAAADSDGDGYSNDLEISLGTDPDLMDPAPTTVGSDFSFDVAWAGDSNFTATGLPAGLTISSTTGRISGVPLGVTSGDGAVVTVTGDSLAGGPQTRKILVRVGKGNLTLSGITAAAIPVTQTLSTSVIEGTAKNASGVTVGGEWEFRNNGNKPLAGANSYSVIFRPSDGDNYHDAYGIVTLTGTAAPLPLVTFLPPPSLVYDKTGKTHTATAAGVSGFTYEYRGRNSTIYAPTDVAPENAGEYVVKATSADPNYTGFAEQEFTITKAPAILTLGSLSPTYNGSPKPVTVSTDPVGVTFSIQYNGGSTVPSNAGTYPVLVTVTDPNYSGSKSGTLAIAKANPVIAAPPTASAITYGQTLNDSVLTGGTSTPSGGFAFTAPTTKPNAGTADQGVTFTPGDADNYNTVATTVSVLVNPAPLTITGISIANKPFDGTKAATITGTASYVGLVNGETFAVTGTPTAVFLTPDVGNGKAVEVNGYTAPSANYTVTQPSGLTANITATAITDGNIPLNGSTAFAENANGYTSTGTLRFSLQVPVEYLVVAGGGAGGGRDVAGGGGAGGVLDNVGGTPLLITGNTNLAVTVGAGGIGVSDASGNNGGNSSLGSVTAVGGGGGSYYNQTSKTGGSGGGGGRGDSPGNPAGGAATPGQGNAGGNGFLAGSPGGAGGGGGGAGQAGTAATASAGGRGGDGRMVSITGSEVYYGGGGGGSGHRSGTAASAAGGLGGGGAAAATVSANPVAGQANTGGGGGASRNAPGTVGGATAGANGGSGVVMARYPGGALGTGGTISNVSVGGTNYTLHRFTNTGSATLALTNLSAMGVRLTGGISGSGGIQHQGPGTLTLASASTYNGPTVIDAGATLQLENAGTLGSGNVTNNGTLVFNLTSTNTLANLISGTGSVWQVGAGTTILTGANSYSGGTLISDGVLEVGDGGTGGSLGSGPITNNKAVVWNKSSDETYSMLISGTGRLRKTGTGTLTLAKTNTYTGPTVIHKGTLKLTQIEDPVNLPGYRPLQGTITVQSMGTLAFATNYYNQLGANANGFTQPLTPVIVDGGTIESGGTVTTLTNLVIHGGKLRGTGGFGDPWGAFVLLGTVNVTADASFEAVSGTDNAITPGFWVGNETVTFQVTNGATLTNGLPIEDYGAGNTYSVTKTGGGTLIFNATNTYTGATTVNEGILRVGATGRVNGGTVTVNSGAQLEGSGAINSLSVASGGVLKISAVATNSAGAWNTGGSITFASGATVDAGAGSLAVDKTHYLVRASSINGTPTVLNAGNFAVSTTGNVLTLSPKDTDNDGLLDFREGELGTNPSLADTDGDGLSDKQELDLSTDPTSAASLPKTKVVYWGPASGVLAANLPGDLPSDIVKISAGENFALALSSSGRVYAWGANESGQTNVPAGALSGVVDILAAGGASNGGGFAYARKVDGTVVGWGSAANITNLPANVVKMAGWGNQGLLLDASGRVYQRGPDNSGTAGVNNDSNWQSGVADIGAARYNHLAVKGGVARVVGIANHNALVVPAEAQSNVQSVTAHGGSTLTVVRSNNDIVMWGKNDSTQVVALKNLVDAGSFPGVTVTRYAAGSSADAQLVLSQTGRPTIRKFFPTQGYWSGLLDKDGKIWAWGNADTPTTAVPAAMSSNVIQAAGGRLFALALVLDQDGDGLADNVETDTGTYVSSSNTGTDPLVADTDGDGLNDGVETNTGTYVSATNTGTDPHKADTDGDGLNDGMETNTGTYVSATNTGTDPHKADTDGDGIADGLEVAAGTDPVNVINLGGETTDVTNSVAYAGTKSLVKSGTNKVTVLGANTCSGGITINAGTLVFGNGFSDSAGGSGVGPFTIGNGATLRVTANQLWFNGNPTFNFTSSGGGTIDTSTSASVNFIMANNAVYTSAGGAQNQIIGSSAINMNLKALTFDVAKGTDNAADLVVAVPLGNSANGITKTGNGTMRLSGSNSYTGPTLVGSGTLQIGASGRVVSSAITVSNLATLTVNGAAGSVSAQSGGTVQGSGTITNLAMASNSVLKITSVSTNTTAAWNTAGPITFSAGATVNANAGSLTADKTYYLVRGTSITGTPTVLDSTSFTVSTAGGNLTLTPKDTDGDGLSDFTEGQLGTNPGLADTDGDGLSDKQETDLGINPLVTDTDGDGLSDGAETGTGTFVSAPGGAQLPVTFTIVTNKITDASDGGALVSANGGSMSGKIMNGTDEAGEWFLSDFRYTRKAIGGTRTLTGATFATNTGNNPYERAGVGVDMNTGGVETSGVMKFSYSLQLSMKPGYRAAKIFLLGNNPAQGRNYGPALSAAGNGGSIVVSGFRGANTGTVVDPNDNLVAANGQTFSSGTDLQGYKGPEKLATEATWYLDLPGSEPVFFSADFTGQSSLSSEGTAFSVQVFREDTGSNPLLADSDGDGLNDNVETASGTFVSAANPGTNPNLADSDGDGVNDGVEIAAGTSPVTKPAFPAGTFAVTFNGTSTQRVISTRPVQDDFTLAFWIKTSQAGTGSTHWFEGSGLLDGEVGGVTDDFGTSLMAGGKVGFGVGNPDITLISAKSVNNNAWRHVAVTREATTGAMKIYIDGVLDRSGTGPTGTKNAPPRLTLGSLQTNLRYFSGEMADFRIYDRVVGAADIWLLANRLSVAGSASKVTLLVDTDNDGLDDAIDPDPTKADTDGDGLTDGQEVNTYGSNPQLADTDSDGVSDKAEVDYGTSPTVSTVFNRLINGSFEDGPDKPSSGAIQTTNVIGWKTSATDRMIELWASGFLGSGGNDGAVLAELNAFEVSTLYQDVTMTANSAVSYSFLHRGRDGTDVMEFRLDRLAGGPGSAVEANFFSRTVSTGMSWVRYHGTLPETVEAGRTYRFSFSSITPAGSTGNLLDAAFFEIDRDADGLTDSVETNTGTYISTTNTGTDPLDDDSDNDGLKDGEEVFTHQTNPLLTDTDTDGAPDNVEVTAGTDPKLASSNPKPVIGSQPAATTATIGASASFTVSATNPVFTSIQGSGAGVAAGARDPNWRIVAVPAGFTPPETLPYAAFVPAAVDSTFAGGAANAGVNGTRWISPAATSAAILTTVDGNPVGKGNAYHWIAAQTFAVADEGWYDFNFPAAGDNAIEFYLGGTINVADPARPTILGGTQIGVRQEGFAALNSFTGRAYLTAGTHTAYMVLIDYGGDTAAIIGPSRFAVGMTYQWKKNGEDIPGETSSTLTLPLLAIDSEGGYAVTVGNAYGSVTSSPAALTVNKATPVIEAAPVSEALTYGQALNQAVLTGGVVAKVGGLDVDGFFSFDSGALKPGAGTAQQDVTFTPLDTDSYLSVSLKVTVTVNKKALTVKANNQTRFYGQANPTFTVAYSGLVAGETAITPAPTLTTTANGSSLPGSYAIEVTGSAHPNYDVTFVNGTLTVRDGDQDGDGVGDSAEIAAGTNPANPADRPMVLSAGWNHTLFVPVPGQTALAWGVNTDGRCGLGHTNSPVLTGVEVVGEDGTTKLSNVIAVAAGGNHSLILTRSATGMQVWSAGTNTTGQLGLTNTATDRFRPILSGLPTNITALAAGSKHSLALSANGQLYAWGDNLSGQIGVNSTRTTVRVPTLVSNLSTVTVKAIGAGAEHSLALAADGKVYSWGRPNGGALGYPGISPVRAPQLVTALTKPISQMAAGDRHSLFLTTDGEVYASGMNSAGQLGLPVSVISTSAPTKLTFPAGTQIKKLVAGLNRAHAIAADGKVYAWGYNRYGELGLGYPSTNEPYAVFTPTEVPALYGSKEIAGGGFQTFALDASGTLLAAGLNDGGQLGVGSTNTVTTNAPAPTKQANKLDQEITFPVPSGSFPTATSLILAAEVNSGLNPVYTSSAPQVARVEGSMLRFLTPGTVRITATQPGDATFNAAIPVTRELTVVRDATVPVVTLQGAASLSLFVGDSFTEPGYTALDAADGDLTDSVYIGGAVNTAVAGTYTLTYQVEDVAGNLGEAVRTVVVSEPPPLTLQLAASPAVMTNQPVGTNGVAVDSGLQILGRPGINLSAATVKIVSGRQTGDALALSGYSGPISATYNSNSGTLRLSGTANLAGYQEALQKVVLSTTNRTVANRTITMALGSGIAFTNGHVYEVVETKVNWATAKSGATTRQIHGVPGYLANVTSAQENEFVRSVITANAWLGGSDEGQEGTWTWRGGPETGQSFRQGGGTPADRYANWGSGEPNNGGSGLFAKPENHLQIRLNNGLWNDEIATAGYVVEYGASATHGLLFAGTRTIQVIQPEFSWRENADGVAVTGYSGSGGEVVIPASLGGLAVNRIDPEAFKGNTAITKVTIPATVQTIGYYAFANCSNLRTVQFLGNAPLLQDGSGAAFAAVSGAVVLYDPATTGWGSTFGGLSTAAVSPFGANVILGALNSNVGVPAPVGMGQNFTLEFWMKARPTVSTQYGATVLTKTSSVPAQEISVVAEIVSDTAGTLMVTLGPIGGAAPQSLSASLNQPKEWNHVAIVQTTTSAQVFINGVSTSAPLTLNSPVVFDEGTPLVFGNGFRGQIDDIRIYGSARTGAEILADLAAPAAAPYDLNLFAYYKCDEVAGTVLNDAVRGSFFSAYANGIEWSPGRSPGAWHLAEGDYLLANDGTSLLLELGGTTPTTLYDQIFLQNGIATLDGIVNLMFIGTYTGPVSGSWHTFDLIWAQNGIRFGDHYQLTFSQPGYTVDTAVVQKDGGELWQATVREAVTQADLEQAAALAQPALGVAKSPGTTGAVEMLYTYTRPTGGAYVNGQYTVGGIRYGLFLSGDLRNWGPAVVEEIRAVPAAAGYEIATVRVVTGGTKAFLKLEVSN